MSCMFEENNDTTHNIKICVFFQRVKMILNAEKKTICSDHKMYEHFLNLSIVLEQQIMNTTIDIWLKEMT